MRLLCFWTVSCKIYKVGLIMKKYFSLIILGILICLLVTGCTYFKSPVVPPWGGSINITKAPVDITFNKTKIGSKKGESSSYQILWLISFGDASVYSAAREGNMSTVTHIDCDLLNILGFYMRYTTIVYGE